MAEVHHNNQYLNMKFEPYVFREYPKNLQAPSQEAKIKEIQARAKKAMEELPAYASQQQKEEMYAGFLAELQAARNAYVVVNSKEEEQAVLKEWGQGAPAKPSAKPAP